MMNMPVMKFGLWISTQQEETLSVMLKNKILLSLCNPLHKAKHNYVNF